MNYISNFEDLIADFYSAPFAVATDCCTHAIELCLRLKKITQTSCPTNSYLSIPMTLEKLKIQWNFEYYSWSDYYELKNTDIIDAAVFWKKDGYVSGKYMCLSFQYKKHLNLGKGGMILLDNKKEADMLRKMSYDGRLLDFPWKDQDVDIYGYHYYMTPETAKSGIEKFQYVKDQEARKWSSEDYPYLPNFKVFKNRG
jgi:dTDP-4-amino-4,6-dideoxygalactose transaminase